MNNIMTKNLIIAIAGIYESCLVVKHIAWQGHIEPAILHQTLQPLFNIDTGQDCILNIYDSIHRIKNGLQAFIQSMEAATKVDSEINRYVYSLILLASKLNKQSHMLNYIARELDAIRHTVCFDDSTVLANNAIVMQLADIYQNSISKLSPRIMINGHAEYLVQEQTAQNLRATLLAGIRSAILWRRCGGTRIKLLLNRRRYIKTANTLLAEAQVY